MVQANRVGFWRTRYELSADGQPLGTWEGRTWRTGGTLEVAGRRYRVDGNAWASRFRLTDESGVTIAEADRVGRKRWTVTAGGRTFQFQRASIWRGEERLIVNEQPVGAVRRTSVWRGHAVADLPGLSLPVQAFVLVGVLTMWDASGAAGA